MKICRECEKEKSLDEFNNHKKSPDGKYYLCKLCFRAMQRENYANNPDRRRQIRQNDKVYVERNRQKVRAYKQVKGCADCGYNAHWAALQFDHLRDKEFNIADKVRKLSWNTILKEIEKCEVVCANCHSIRTVERLNKAV
jgi:hypothetical protein